MASKILDFLSFLASLKSERFIFLLCKPFWRKENL